MEVMDNYKKNEKAFDVYYFIRNSLEIQQVFTCLFQSK